MNESMDVLSPREELEQQEIAQAEMEFWENHPQRICSLCGYPAGHKECIKSGLVKMIEDSIFNPAPLMF